MVNPFPYIGPIPPFTNVPIESQFYLPSRFVIEEITRGLTTIITTTENHNYVIGQQVRTLIPTSFGTYQLNEIPSYVISIPDLDKVEIDIDSRFMDAFIQSSAATVAQIIAIGDISNGAINTSGNINLKTFIPGSFINVSPL